MYTSPVGVPFRDILKPPISIHKKVTMRNWLQRDRKNHARDNLSSGAVSVAKKPRVELSQDTQKRKTTTVPAKERVPVAEDISRVATDVVLHRCIATVPVAPERDLDTTTCVDLKKPKVPDIDIQEARILFRNSALVKYLRSHKRGDWVKNPHRFVSGKHCTDKTKERAADAIKGVVRDWLLTTTQGKRALAAANISEGELSIDPLIARHDKNGMGLNCIYNLYIMPSRHNSHFGDQLSSEKRAYVGERAYKLAKGAHDAFVRDTERDYDWDEGFSRRAEFIVCET